MRVFIKLGYIESMTNVSPKLAVSSPGTHPRRSPVDHWIYTFTAQKSKPREKVKTVHNLRRHNRAAV
jgi:hypothetical protein